MFTGIIREIGKIERVSHKRHTKRLSVKAALISKDAQMGDSVSTDGACLTVSDKSKDILHFDVMSETLRSTTLDQFKKGDRVNLEPALKLNEGDLSGHLVSGHIDEIGVIKAISKGGRETARFTIRISPKNSLLLVNKGSVAVNGISLTVSETGRDYFVVNMIPHSLKETTMETKRVGDRVNVEYDIMGKYAVKNSRLNAQKGVDEALLKECGFM